MSPRTAKPQAAEPAPARRLEVALAFAFGCVALAVVLWLAFRAQSLSQQQFEILRMVLALAGGGVGAMDPRLPGREPEAERQARGARRRRAGGVRYPLFLLPGSLGAAV
jgi:hypothetical protein